MARRLKNWSRVALRAILSLTAAALASLPGGFCALPSETARAGELALLPPVEESPSLPTPTTGTESRLAQLERENARLAADQEALLESMEALSEQYESLAAGFAIPPTGLVEATAPRSSYYDRDRGAFVLVPGRDDQPFELRADLFTEARYTAFRRDEDTWTDSTGAVRPVENFDSLEINRNFIQLSGHAIDPNLQFSAMIFSSTALNDTLYLGWINYRFSDALDVRVGSWLLPGTREWFQSFRYTLGVDRTMATTFFRPNISPGIWAQGTLLDNVRYVAMFANSQNRLSQGIERTGTSRAVSGTLWWEPTGDFGLGPSDIEFHQAPSFRLGTSMTFSKETNQGLGDPAVNNPEDTILRLSDGTPLFRAEALGPGVVLESVRYNLWAVDAAVKYRGLSLSFEYLFRLLDDFVAQGTPAPQGSLFDHGGLLEGGAFLIPSKLEVYARTSHVTGEFGTGSEYAGGVNWYPRASREWRLTTEVTQIVDSPAQNLLTGYRAGQNGTLLQVECFVDF